MSKLKLEGKGQTSRQEETETRKAKVALQD